MEIKTITCHDVYNYGASLQAYALQHYLESQGHEVKIIDYKPGYQNRYFKFWYVPPFYPRLFKISKQNIFLHFLCALKLIPFNFGTWRRKKPFDDFTAHYLRLTNRYATYEELLNNPPVADVYIAGSDQIWNCNMDNGRDPAFFLQFGDDRVNKISYAASFAIPEIPEDYKQYLVRCLESFTSISVRENTGVRIVEQLGFRAVNVLDPVFLLSKDEWYSHFNRKPLVKGRYLLVYNLSRDTRNFDEAVKKISRKYNLKVVSIDAYRRYPFSDKSIHNAGPWEFVNLIANSSYVIADSFHAMAFSLIFNKSFSIFYNYNNISRMKDILGILGLNARLNTSEDSLIDEWWKINEVLEAKKRESQAYLNKAIYV